MVKHLFLVGFTISLVACHSTSLFNWRIGSRDNIAPIDFASAPLDLEDGEVYIGLDVVPINNESQIREVDRLQTLALGTVKPPIVAPGPYIIGLGDVLLVKVWGHPELSVQDGQNSHNISNGLPVSNDGSIFYPYVGEITAAGKSSGQLRSELRKRLSRFIQNPQLDIRIVEFRSKKVFVVGEVVSQGLQPITNRPLTLIEAIDNAGGVTDEADLGRITLTRGNSVYNINLTALFDRGDVSQNIVLIADDILNIPNERDNKIYVVGEVIKPSSFTINRGRRSLESSVNDAGGVNAMSTDPVHYFVIRQTPKNPKIFHLDTRTVEALILAGRFNLVTGDIVYVVTAKKKHWSRVYRQISLHFLKYGSGIN